MTRGELYRLRHPSGDTRRTRCFVVVSRPALIASRFSTVICAPVYSQRRGLSTELPVGADEDGFGAVATNEVFTLPQ